MPRLPCLAPLQSFVGDNLIASWFPSKCVHTTCNQNCCDQNYLEPDILSSSHLMSTDVKFTYFPFFLSFGPVFCLFVFGCFFVCFFCFFTRYLLLSFVYIYVFLQHDDN